METSITSTAGELIELVTTAAGIFKIYPINIFLVGSLMGLAFKLFRKGKRVAG